MRAKILKSCRNCCSVPKQCSTANWSSTSGGATTATFYFNWQSENKAVTHSVSPAAKCQSVGRVGLLTCRIKRASSAACCTVDREGAALVGTELGLRAAPPGTTSSFRAGRASSALDLASSLRTFTLVRGQGLDNATMNGRHFQFRSDFSCCLIVDFSHFPMASCSCSCTIYIYSQPHQCGFQGQCYFKPKQAQENSLRQWENISEKMKLLMGLRWNRWHSFAMRRLWAPCLVYRCRSQPHFPHFSSEAIDKPALSWLINRLSDWLLTSHFISN